jgi:hypothetical protein
MIAAEVFIIYHKQDFIDAISAHIFTKVTEIICLSNNTISIIDIFGNGTAVVELYPFPR